MDISRRDFFHGLGVFSFSLVLGVPTPGSASAPAHTLYGADLKGGQENEHIKAAYLGVGALGLEVGQGMSRYLNVILRRFPGSDQEPLQAMLGGTRTIRAIETNLEGKDIIAVVGDARDQGLDYARKLALRQAKSIWTVVLCLSGADDDVKIRPAPNETIRFLRHSRFPLDRPEVFTQMLRDVWHCHKSPPLQSDMCEALSDLGI